MEDNYKLTKWLNDELSEAELTEFQSGADYHLYKKIKDYSSDLTTSEFDEQHALTQVLAVEKSSSKTIRFNSNFFMRVAASLIIGLGMYFAATSLSATALVAEDGSQTAFVLPDRSEVTLNSGSRIFFMKWLWDENRNLRLLGEAYFKVEKGKAFKVKTPLGDVTVLGTQFNVKVRNNRLDVTCYEGRVKVAYQNQQTIVTKGHTVSFEDDEQIINEEISFSKPHWLQHQIAFEKAKLADVFEEIQRVYGVKIQFKNVESEQLFSGILPADKIDVALQVIATTYHLKVIKSNDSHYALEIAK